MTELPPWDPDEYDRRILRERRGRERASKRNSNAGGQVSAFSTIHYTRSIARGVASEEELQRRARMDTAMRRNRKRGTV